MLEDTTPKIRHHSNTISAGDTALNIDTSLAPPVRRNSEGSPSLPPNINVSEPTPLEPSFDKNNMFPSQKSAANEDDGDNRSILSNNSNTSYLNSPGKTSRKSRSRASSITSNIINEIKESSTIQKVASKIKNRHSLDESDIPDTSSSIAVSVPGVSGVYLASAKRNQDFHSLFRSVPEEDGLIEDFGCALQKEILLQGRIYISESYLCFNANIFGWVTNLVIAFADIIEIEKKSTAYFIPNAIQISTDSAKHFFASFLSRDQAYDLMIDIWRTARPDLAPPKEVDESVQSPEAESLESSDDDSGSSFYDSDTEDSYSDETDPGEPDKPVTQDDGSKTRKASVASAAVNSKEVKMDPNRRRAMSEAVKPRSIKSDDEKPLPPPADNNTKETDETSATKSTESKPQVHEKTDCDCKGDHFPNVVMDQTYYGSLEKFDDLLFKSDFMSKFLVDNQKSTEFEMGEWKKGEGKVEKVREYSYIKPLGGSIGPKSTKCYITQEILFEDFEKSVTSLATTATPDVPSGGSFTCKTKTCLTYAGKGKVRMLVTVLVDFTKSSWLKSTIEKASIDGQQTYYKDLDAEINAYIKQHPNEFGKPAEGKRKKRDKQTRHRRQRIPDEKKVEAEPPKTLVQQILGHLSEAASSTINTVNSPRAAHLTLFCLIIMVGVNLFIARKMAFVEHQLIQLGKSGSNNIQESTVDAPGRKSAFMRQEEDDLWEWLCRVDPDKSNDVTEQIKMFAIKDPKEQEVWDDAIKNTKLAKDRLDKHMVELSSMIQKAEDSLEDITKAVHEQRQKIKSQP